MAYLYPNEYNDVLSFIKKGMFRKEVILQTLFGEISYFVLDKDIPLKIHVEIFDFTSFTQNEVCIHYTPLDSPCKKIGAEEALNLSDEYNKPILKKLILFNLDIFSKIS